MGHMTSAGLLASIFENFPSIIQPIFANKFILITCHLYEPYPNINFVYM